ncbi:antibiotic biosynthesis monooxygenase [Kitasatospora aureofaciens]|uniref:antibiotic biosynthesis monooxygenase n=1 Tax=Kitasatospora aureofaciens TaxID=1894 RepID=UPI001C44909F|nr:antibiotic biosynthesis monooxygenase [Kitasatospora aureofaciens]MBV6698280.1 antibiotic biosynthesis monooxygenase [Kitasatospora aureofaciens]
MFVRTVYATGNPDRIDRTLDGLRAEAVGLLTAQPGYRGYGLFADRALGKIVMSSWWESAQAERDSNQELGQRCAEVLAPLAGTVTTDVWEAVVTAPPGEVGPGAGFRLVRVEVDPAKVDTMTEVFRDRALPMLEKMDGFVTGAMLVDRASGQASVGAIFADQESFAASRGPQADARAQAVAAVGATVRSVEEFDVVLLDRRRH